MAKKLIFLHSLFRTGSTYLWSKFRDFEDCHCYYEPLNQFLLDIDDTYYRRGFSKEFTGGMHHPVLDRHYLAEYEHLFPKNLKGLPNLRKRFIVEQFCDATPDEEFIVYLNYLIDNARQPNVVLQFNRTALRARLFAAAFGEACHIYLVRNPRDQWKSYMDYYNSGHLRIFTVTDLMIVGMNAGRNLIRPLEDWVPLFPFKAEEFKEEERFYDALSEFYSNEERYFIFYYLWLVALIEQVSSGHVVVNINLLSGSEEYRRSAGAGIEKCSGKLLDLDDAAIRQYESSLLPEGTLEAIEDKVMGVVAGLYGRDRLRAFVDRLSEADGRAFGIDRSCADRRPPLPQDDGSVEKSRQDKIASFLLSLSHKNDEIALLNDKVEEGRMTIDRIGLANQAKYGKLQEMLDMKDDAIEARNAVVHKRNVELNRIKASLAYKLFYDLPRHILGVLFPRKPE